MIPVRDDDLQGATSTFDKTRPAVRVTSAAANDRGEHPLAVLVVETSRLYARAWHRLATDLGWVLTLSGPHELVDALTHGPTRHHELVILSLSPRDPETIEVIRRLRSLPTHRSLPYVLATSAMPRPSQALLRERLGVHAIVERSDMALMSQFLRDLQSLIAPPLRVAYVEDSRVAGRHIQDLLVNFPHLRLNLDHHVDPETAIVAHRREPYDIVLLDWTFPGAIQGPDVVRALVTTGTPAIVVLSEADVLHHLPADLAMWIELTLPKHGADAILLWSVESLGRAMLLQRLLRSPLPSE